MLLVGILLVAGIGLIAVEAVGYNRGENNAEFWRLPLDEKLVSKKSGVTDPMP
jgi:hypothetical protein